jgi:EAL domain
MVFGRNGTRRDPRWRTAQSTPARVVPFSNTPPTSETAEKIRRIGEEIIRLSDRQNDMLKLASFGGMSSRMTADHDSHEIVRLIISLAHGIGLNVVAEGTETEEQISELKRLDCEMAQRFFYSPPVEPKAAFELLLRSYRTALR